MTFPALVALTIASAIAYSRCFPTTSLHALAWVSIAPYLAAGARTRSVAHAVFLAWLWTVVAAWELNDWFPRAVSEYFLQPAAVGYLFFIVVSTLTALPYMAFGVWLATVGPLPGAVRPLVVGAAWVAAELGRTLGPIGDPWGLAGYSQARVLPIVQIADLTGVYGPSFMIAAVNAALVKPRQLSGLLLAALTVAAAWGYGMWRLDEHSSETGRVPVSVVQANVDVGSQWREELHGRNLDVHLRATRATIERDRVALVVWPESALTFFLEDEPWFRAAIGRELAPSRAELVVGGPRKENGAGTERFFNAAFLVRSDGRVVGWYDKEHLLPFAEYFPIPQVDFLRRRFGRIREFSAGGPPSLLPTVAGQAGVVICNESLFAAPAAARARTGAELLIALANDSWLGDARYAEQAFDMAIVRAVEQRRFLIRASTSGPSAIVDPVGRVLVRTEFPSAATITGFVAPRSVETIYSRVGDTFAWACFAIAAAGWGVARRRRSAA